jgi:hypothetical protein
MLMTLPELDAALPLASREGLLEHAWVDRDLSWLEFNRRVLHEALDERTPLLERVKFLAIFTANLDEFYMKRVASCAASQASSTGRPPWRAPAPAPPASTPRAGLGAAGALLHHVLRPAPSKASCGALLRERRTRG